MPRPYNYNICTRAQSETMCHVGIDRETTKEAVKQRLTIGQKYQLKSVNATKDDKPKDAVCELMSMEKNMAIFKHQNGTLESFTYQDLWKQMVDGDLI